MSESPHQRLRRSLFGYRRTQVEVALAELRLTLRHLQDDLAETRERAATFEHDLREARIELDSRRARETEIQQAFDAAQERVREIELSAEATARAILADAEEKASRTRAEAHLRTQPVALVGALRDNLPYGLEIQAIEPGRLTVKVAVAAGTF